MTSLTDSLVALQIVKIEKVIAKLYGNARKIPATITPDHGEIVKDLETVVFNLKSAISKDE